MTTPGSQEDELASLLAETRWLRRLALGLVRSEAEADDLVQDTVFTAMRAGESGRAAPRALLATIMRRLLGKRRRDEARRLAREALAAPRETGDDPARSLERLEAQQRLLAALKTLSASERQVLVLRYFDNLAPKAIAAQLELPLETVKSRLKRGLEHLRDDLGRDRGGNFRLAILPLFLDGWTLKTTIGGAGGLMTLKGATLMTTSTKIGLAVTAVALVACGYWFFHDFGQADSGFDRSTAVAEMEIDAPRPVSREGGVVAESRPAIADRQPGAEAPREIQRVEDEARDLHIRGRVVDELGSPVAGALVRLLEDEDAAYRGLGSAVMDMQLSLMKGSPYSPDQAIESRSSETGEFVFVRPGRPKTVTLEAGDLVHGVGLRLAVPVPESGDLVLEVVLESGVIVTGVVTDSAGRPLAGVSINIAAGRDDSFQTVAILKTDVEGRYRSIALPFTKFIISASREDHIDAHHRENQATIGTELRCDFALERKLESKGRIVVDGGSEARLLDAIDARFGAKNRAAWLRDHRLRVCLSSDDPQDDLRDDMVNDRETTADFDKDSYVLRGQYPGHVAYVLAGSTILGRAVVGPEGLAPDIPIDLAVLPDLVPRTSIVVSVKDDKGRPVDRFSIIHGLLFNDDEFHPDGSTRRVIHGTGGLVTLDDLRPGTWLISVEVAGHAATRDLVKLAGDARHLDVEVVPAAGVLFGRVLDEIGNPLVGAFIHVLGRDEQGAWSLPLAPRILATDATGAYRIENLPSRPVLVLASLKGMAATSSTTTIENEPRELDFRMRRGEKVAFSFETSGGGCSFTILDRSGLPIYEERVSGVQHFGGATLDLPSGRLRAVIRCRGAGTADFEFDAVDGAEIPVNFQD